MAEPTLPLRAFLGFPPLLFPSVTARSAPKRTSVIKICWEKTRSMRFLEKGDEKEKKEKEITLREIVDGNEVERKMDKEEEVVK